MNAMTKAPKILLTAALLATMLGACKKNDTASTTGAGDTSATSPSSTSGTSGTTGTTGDTGTGATGTGTTGDTLSGIITGLAARGATLEQAACWGVALHARAGERLAERMGVLGYLAREIPDEIPALLESVAGTAAGNGKTIRPAPGDTVEREAV